MPSFQFVPRFFQAVIVSIFLFTLTHGAWHDPLNPNQNYVSGSLETTNFSTQDCHPGSGWVWTPGPVQPEIASLAQSELLALGIEPSVEAKIYGETDSCGEFRPYAMDFSITITDADPAYFTEANRQALAREVVPILAKLAEPKLGNVEINFPEGERYSLEAELLNEQLARFSLAVGWEQITTSVSPSGRYLYGLAYDDSRHVAVLFGGDNTGAARLNDTWEYNGSNWYQVTPAQSPPGRVNIDQTLVFDSSRQRTILFGGLGSSGYLNDTWEYDGTNWAQIVTSLTPSQRDSHAMVFDRHRNVSVLFGGFSSLAPRLNDTWEYNGAWQQITTTQAPSARYHHAMAFDSTRNATVLFGGADEAGAKLADTWEYDGTTWRQVTPLQSPPARENHSLAYDSAHGVVILFGGVGNSGVLNDTWEYDGTTWRQISSAQLPSPRTEMSLAYDSLRDKTMFFGGGIWGTSGLSVFNDTWEYTSIWAPPSSDTLNKNVYVIIYNPTMSNGQGLIEYMNWNSPDSLTQGTVDFFKTTSDDKVQYTVVDTTVVTDEWPALVDGFQYTEDTYLSVLSGYSAPHEPSWVDYNRIVNSALFDICGKANRGEIDEVWIYEGPYFGFYESTLVGPGAYWYNSPPVPEPYSCNKLVPIMAPNPERGLECAIENFGHRTESTMFQVYGSWQQNRTNHNWERFALVDALSPDYAYSGCGNIHYPPNGVSDYDYSNTSTALTNCENFASYPYLSDPGYVLEPVTCSTWGCSHLEYFRYWFSHFPNNSGCGPDQVANSWWRYFANPALALNPITACGGSVFLPYVKR